jgi:hypothetical protein
MTEDIIKLPEYPDFEDLHTIHSEGSFWDHNEIDNLNSTLIRTVLNLKEITRQINDYERQRTQLDVEYKHKFRRLMVDSTVKTESQKKRIAEIECEDLEFRLAYIDEVINELTKISQSLRIDLDILKTIGFNIRQELKL